jgi:hypothetical protein
MGNGRKVKCYVLNERILGDEDTLSKYYIDEYVNY